MALQLRAQCGSERMARGALEILTSAMESKESGMEEAVVAMEILTSAMLLYLP